MDPSLRGSLQLFQEDSVGTTYSREAESRRDPIPLSSRKGGGHGSCPDSGRRQIPVTCVLHQQGALGAELRYTKLEKLAYALLISSQRLRQYFQGHPIKLRTDQAIRQILQKPNLAGRSSNGLGRSNWEFFRKFEHTWKLHVDRASNQASEGAEIILESSEGVTYEQSIKFEFPVSNNQAEYEALIRGLTLAKEVGTTRFEVNSDSQIITFQVNGTYQVRDPLLQKRKRSQSHKSESARYAVIQGQLYKWGLNQPLLKCLHPDQTDYVLSEVHERCCGYHIGGKTLVRKLVRAGYYWPSMMIGAQKLVRKCKKCQENANFHKAPAEELSSMLASQPFSWWGVDLLGPFPVSPRKLKYLRVAIDYYTKWVEAEPLVSISSVNCRKFLWRQVISRFGIPKTVILDNGTQFANKKF
ncbi:uncharacterized protein LOC110268332 [Arachis ipaensis]|uniref:uncharacterized protein LOC110268332 n=1 Tax=Arachis ipaensis TaxID=130454 RepID=UPI000A2B23FE|nr:uncharacterized protein LOC110268332 [Arachis ipaensis]XP_025684622.1 uncharacterized protein LOC112785367 [Arachis hypogaea]